MSKGGLVSCKSTKAPAAMTRDGRARRVPAMLGVKASGAASRPMMRPREKLRLERVERAMPKINREKQAVSVVVCGVVYDRA